MRREDWKALPFGEVRVEHEFPGQQDITVYVDGEPVARLPVVKVGFDMSYSNHLGHVTLTMLAGDCLILSSRPKRPGSDDESRQQDSQVPAVASGYRCNEIRPSAVNDLPHPHGRPSPPR